MKSSALIASALIVSGWTGLASAADLQVRVLGIQEATGEIRVALYDEAGFPKEKKALQIESTAAKPDSVQIGFGDLKPGRYGLVAYQDVDSDGGMDRFLGMIPTEPYGLSNNPKLSGPPKFEQAAFKLGEDTLVIEIQLQD